MPWRFGLSERHISSIGAAVEQRRSSQRKVIAPIDHLMSLLDCQAEKNMVLERVQPSTESPTDPARIYPVPPCAGAVLQLHRLS